MSTNAPLLPILSCADTGVILSGSNTVVMRMVLSDDSFKADMNGLWVSFRWIIKDVLVCNILFIRSLFTPPAVWVNDCYAISAISIVGWFD